MRRQDMKIWVEELKLIESGTYRDQFLRPYVTEVKGSIVDRIEERYVKSRRFTPSILANIASQFIVPDYFTRGIIEIPHGWGTRRGRFILTLMIEIGTGDRLRQVVMGYTNSVGFTTRHVDHDMEFYINNTFMLKEQVMTDGDGRRKRYWVPTMTNDVLSDRNNDGLRRRGSQLFTMRPEDVYSSLDAEQTLDLVDDVTDLRTTLSKNAIKSGTSNRLASRFMSNVLNGRQKALENNDYSNAAAEVNATAQGYVQENYASDDLFMRRLANVKGTTMTTDNFTFRDLLQIDPEAERRTDPLLLDKDALRLTDYMEDDVNDLSGQEEWDRIAALIGIAVPALMVETGIHNVSFQAHNQELGGQWFFLPSNARSLIKDVDIGPFMDKFEERVIDELLMPITGGNDFDIGVNVNCRAFGEVDFTLYWDGANHGRYVIPCFTNSLASPIVTDDRKDIRKMARDFDSLFDHFLPTTIAGNGGGGYNF
jgi:hypothetical protein